MLLHLVLLEDEAARARPTTVAPIAKLGLLRQPIDAAVLMILWGLRGVIF